MDKNKLEEKNGKSKLGKAKHKNLMASKRMGTNEMGCE